MILVEIRPRGGAAKTIAIHSGVTVLRGLDAAARRTWATDLARALRGETAASLDLEVEVDGARRRLTPNVVRELGLAEAASAVTVFAVDLPGAKATDPPAPTVADDDLASKEADVATADADLRRIRAERAEAERAATAAADALTTAGRSIDKDADRAVTEAEARLEAARAAAAGARRQLEAAEAAAPSEAAAAAAEVSEVHALTDRLQEERSRLEAERATLVGRMVEAGDPGDLKPVEEALAALRRLRSVKPKPSPRAVDLADRWLEAHQRLSSLPQPPQPPEWLVTPALAALQEARGALAEAESGRNPATIDPAKIEALDRAHHEVLEAEQRSMKKGSRLNRRRLDGAHEAEQAALAALGVQTYGEYLQRIAPALEGGPSAGEDRVTAARAALADAEAVWEELHGGEASSEWTAAKEQQAALRKEALALLDRDIEDARIEDELRSHLEVVVDTDWAEQALVTAMRTAGAAPAPGVDVEQAADQWLADAPGLAEARAAIETELSELDGRLSAVEEQLAEHRADAFFAPDSPDGDATAGASEASPVPALREAAEEAEAAEVAAQAAIEAAQARVRSNQDQEGRLGELEAEADERRSEVDRLRVAVADAEAALAEMQRASTSVPTTAPAGAATTAGTVDLSAVVGMEAEAYLLARVAALRGAPAGPLPLVVDAEALMGLSDGAGRRVFRLLGRLAGSMQVVVVGDGESIATWAEGLGDQATVRTVAR